MLYRSQDPIFAMYLAKYILVGKIEKSLPLF